MIHTSNPLGNPMTKIDKEILDQARQEIGLKTIYSLTAETSTNTTKKAYIAKSALFFKTVSYLI